MAGCPPPARAAGGVTVYTPGDLKPGEVFAVTVYPPQKIGAKPLLEWLLGFAKSDGNGDVPKVEKNDAGITVVSRLSRGGRLATRLSVHGE